MQKMPHKKLVKNTKTDKKYLAKKDKTEIREHKNPKTARALRMSGILMMLASVFMVLVPFMYRGVYSFLARNTDMPRVDSMLSFATVAGSVFGLFYCLLGIFVFRAGENGTFLAKGITIFNNVVAVLAIMAVIMVFVPYPDQTFEYALATFSDADKIIPGIIPMGILTLVDLACIVGLVLSVATIDSLCVVKNKKK